MIHATSLEEEEEEEEEESLQKKQASSPVYFCYMHAR
jgi:hypothetical protein